jgi:hypothetical protein
MQLQYAIKKVFVQLTSSLEMLSAEEYTQPSRILFNATIGQHVRHVVELFLCLNNGYESGTVNYEKRKRDYRIETDKELAAALLQEICTGLAKADRSLCLEFSCNKDSDELITVATNYYREVIYNLEHTVHHMALIRVGINEVSSVELPGDFGMASSTIKYRESCAQ